MKYKILMLATCTLSLAAQDPSELYAKAKEYEAAGDYKNAMIYYKKIATASLEQGPHAGQNSTPRGSAERDLAAQNSTALSQNSTTSSSTAQDERNSLAQNSAAQGEQNSENSKNLGILGLKYYEPIYMLFTHDFSKKPDRKADELHFEFSFERPITYDALGLGEKFSFAYTQNSWWQITQDSAPFRESNYRPELYVSAPVPFADELKIGALHESNGKGGAESRSWNKAYVQSTWSSGGFSITPRAWYAFWLDRTNEDIADYMGYGDLRASYTFGKQRLSALWRNNLHFDGSNRGAIELNYSFPIFNSGFYGYLRYFNGYGESLADYKRSVNKIGAGLSFVEF